MFFQVSFHSGWLCLTSSKVGQFSRMCWNVSGPPSQHLHCYVSHFPILRFQYLSSGWLLERSLVISTCSLRLRLASMPLFLGASSFRCLLMLFFAVSWWWSAVCSILLPCSANLSAISFPPTPTWLGHQIRSGVMLLSLFSLISDIACSSRWLLWIWVAELFHSIYYGERISDDFQRFARVIIKARL